MTKEESESALKMLRRVCDCLDLYWCGGGQIEDDFGELLLARIEAGILIKSLRGKAQ